jgi:hypothetical protein
MKIKPIHKSWTIGNHIIHVDMSIKELLERVPLHLKEMKGIALDAEKMINSIGLRTDSRIILVTYSSEVPNDANFLGAYAAIAPIHIPEGERPVEHMVNIFPDKVHEEEKKTRDPAREVGDRKERKRLVKEMLRGSIGMSFAHELTHALGISFGNDKLCQERKETLELLTDSIAFLCAEKVLGEASYIGASYIAGCIERHTGSSSSRDSVQEKAKDIVENFRPIC